MATQTNPPTQHGAGGPQNGAEGKEMGKEAKDTGGKERKAEIGVTARMGSEPGRSEKEHGKGEMGMEGRQGRQGQGMEREQGEEAHGRLAMVSERIKGMGTSLSQLRDRAVELAREKPMTALGVAFLAGFMVRGRLSR